MKKSFTVVELMIVVAILGILAAASLPVLQGHITAAKEAAAKDNLRILRTVIQHYAAEHNSMPPGYINGNPIPEIMYPNQFLEYTDSIGSVAFTKSEQFCYGPYLNSIPENPFNNKNTITRVPENDPFPDSATGTYGWLYKPQDQEIRLDWPGTDKKGVRYYDY